MSRSNEPGQNGMSGYASEETSLTDDITWETWSETPDGRAVMLYHLRTPDGLQASITNYGGVIVRLLTPDRHGNLGDIVLGHDQPERYFDRRSSPFFGAIIGRHANRIAQGRFNLDGRTYQLARNDGPNALHGGEQGFDQRLWNARPYVSADSPALELSYVSADGEEGYPGNLNIKVTYTLTHDGTLQVTYDASTDAPTIVNLTNHTYWNLTGNARQDVLDHELLVHADHITPVDETLVPTGSLLPVDGTPFDFRRPRPIGARLDEDHEQLRFAGGYDHNFVLLEGPGLKPAAILYDPFSGRQLDIRTTEPGLQVYSGNFLDGSVVGKGGQRYVYRGAMCLETQHFPDSPNHPDFPSTLLLPGQHFTSRTTYAFTSRD